MTASEFQQQLLTWFDQHGRKDLPWQLEISPYRVWLSEIMLQQTQVATVIPYFEAFVARFPSINSLAEASLDEVLCYWSGLGYYARARNLHKTAQCIAAMPHFPDELDELVALPGIGRSTAGAILSIAFKQSQAILDGNVKRVLTRCFAIAGWSSLVNKQLWSLSSQLTPTTRTADYTQAIMDLGATLCTRSNPRCSCCPLAKACIALQMGSVEQFPTTRPRKRLLVKHRTLLLLENLDQAILLEKRPPVGIWGGLWSLPEFDDIDAVWSWCEKKNIVIDFKQVLNKQRHSFSHFHLDYTPVYLKTKQVQNWLLEANQLYWCQPEETDAFALPTPIKVLLQFINEKKND